MDKEQIQWNQKIDWYNDSMKLFIDGKQVDFTSILYSSLYIPSEDINIKGKMTRTLVIETK